MVLSREKTPAKSVSEERIGHPLQSLRGDIDRIFDNFMTGWPGFGHRSTGLGGFTGAQLALSPDIDVSETETGYDIEVELPGMDEKDIDITLSDNILMLKGEKRDEREEKKKGYYLSERSYGSFQRSFALPADVDIDGIDTQFRKGVLTINLPKSAEAKAKTKKIEVKAG